MEAWSWAPKAVEIFQVLSTGGWEGKEGLYWLVSQRYCTAGIVATKMAEEDAKS